MCFSAQASFVAGSVLLAVGAVTLKQVRVRSELPYAAIPGLFGVQQLFEGGLWLALASGQSHLASALTHFYAFFSHVLWPVYVPLAVLAIERVGWRRRLLAAFALGGGTTGLYLLYFLLTEPTVAKVVGNHIDYVSPHFYAATVLIRTRIDMLTTGVRTPVGVKVFGENLEEIERISVALEGMLRDVPGTRSTFAERQTGREYVDIVPDRDKIARYGLTVRDVQDTIEAAIGGANISTAIAGRARFTINLRYAADFRGDPEAIRNILIPVQSTGPAVTYGGTNSGAGSSPSAGPMVSAPSASGDGMGGGMSGGSGGGGGGMGTQGAGAAMAPAPSSAGALAASPDFIERWRPPGAAVPLGQIADVSVVTGPPMIKDENGVLVGYVYADIDPTARDLGGWVDEAKTLVESRLVLPAGYRLEWTGQYEFLAEMEARLRYVLPLTLLLIVGLLFLATRGWMQTFLVLASLPFAIAGSVWLLAAMSYNMSAAVWVGIIAVAGVAAQTGIVMIVYLDEAFERHLREGRIQAPEDVDAAIIEGAAMRVRPLVMTVATTVLGLMPLLWEAGVGADVSARTAAPVVGGLWSCMVLTLLVLPAAYSIWRRRQLATHATPVAAPAS